MKKITRKRILKTLLALFVVSLLAMFWADHVIKSSTKNQIFDDINALPNNKVGLLLGTSKYLKLGDPNPYFQYRIDATAALFEVGKIQDVVISGDNGRENYNEPEDMKQELLKRGIPENHIYLDYAGFRTFDSVYRMSEIFGQKNFTIISQEFHNQRAVYIANKLGLNAVGYNAKNVDSYNGMKTNVREKFARVKVLIDFWIEKKPKFLGEKVIIK